MSRVAIAVAAALSIMLLATDALACRQGRLAYPPGVGSENAELIRGADHIFVGRVIDPARVGGRVHAQIEPSRVIRGVAEALALDDQRLPSTCPGIASQRLGTIEVNMPVLVLIKEGQDGFSVVASEGVLLMLGADDLLALIEPELGG